MSRIDWIVLQRLASRIALTLTIFFGLFALVESLDSWRFQMLSGIGGPFLALLAIVAAAARSLVGTLAVTVLIGTIIGVLDLQSRRELTVIKSTGVSIWRVLRAPLAAVFLLGAFAAFYGDTLALNVSRSLPAAGERSNTLWLEQDGAAGPYVLVAEHSRRAGIELDEVTIFFRDAETGRERITAKTARLEAGEWVLAEVTRARPDSAPEELAELRLPTMTTAGDMRVRLTSARDLTFDELWSAVRLSIADPELRASALTSLLRLFTLPALLCGSVLIGFAFTAGYQRTNKYGGTVLYGVVLGFVVYVVTELAYRSGFAGVLDPVFAAAGPAFVAIVTGLTVLLYREDGRT